MEAAVSGTGFYALLRFHLRSGVRVALRSAALQAILFAIAIGMTPEPRHSLEQLVRGVAGPEGFTLAPVLFALAALATATMAAHRLQLAELGWILSLPVSGRHRRRVFTLALVVAQAPVGLLWLASWIAGAALGGAQVARLPGLLVALYGAAHAALPLHRSWLRPLGIVAALLAAAGEVPGLWLALVLLGALELAAGTLRRPAKEPRHRSSSWPARLLPTRIAWRALRWRILGPLVGSGLAIGGAILFLRNNVLSAAEQVFGVRVGGALAVVLPLVWIAGLLRERRPPWAFGRSLPWPSRRRALEDAAFLALHALPAVIAAAVLAPVAALPLVPLLAFLALRLAAALRGPGDQLTRLGSWAITEAWLAALWVGVSPWVGILLLLALPWALDRAGSAERRWKISPWEERHHALGGDPGA